MRILRVRGVVVKRGGYVYVYVYVYSSSGGGDGCDALRICR